MELSKQTDYALRILIFLAGVEGKATIQSIATKFDLPYTHAMKIVNKLVNAGMASSTRGKFGGVQLGVGADKINLRQVVFLMENNLRPVNCSEPVCKIKEVCALMPIMFGAQEAFLKHIEQYTLADLVTTDVVAFLTREDRAAV